MTRLRHGPVSDSTSGGETQSPHHPPHGAQAVHGAMLCPRHTPTTAAVAIALASGLRRTLDSEGQAGASGVASLLLFNFNGT